MASAPATSAAGHKRKAAGFVASSHATSARKRQKYQDARNIPSQTADRALSKSGELNIASFIQAREYEINALDNSMRKARQNLMARAFQQVPRHLRRRTASHNAQKVPRRLRGRAQREMKDDNTPTVTSKTRTPSSKLRLRLETAKVLKNINQKRRAVRRQKREGGNTNLTPTDLAKNVLQLRTPKIKSNTLAQPSGATDKFKRRQVSKTWLPTHLWHAKRARMTRPTVPLWRLAIPLTPSEKSYRPSHRAAGNRGAIAWDKSYISTIGCRGTENALEGLLKAIKFAGEGWDGAKYRRWRAGTRAAMSWACTPKDDGELIAPITVIWAPKLAAGTGGPCSSVPERQSDDGDNERVKTRARLDSRIFIRLHPSAFHEFWLQLLTVAKAQKPQVLIEDLRFEIGSIEITGIGSTEALLGVLKPADPQDASAKLWTSLIGLTNPASLPQNALLSFGIIDPRLAHPPRQIQVPQDEASSLALLQTLADWPTIQHPNGLSIFSHKQRHLASKLPTQKALRWRKGLSLTAQTTRQPVNDISIPVLLFTQKPKQSQSSSQGSWVVLAPWKCINPIWRSLMYYPLSSGGTPRFGGLQEEQQLAFEQSVPWFPGDSPGTESGKMWERTQSEDRFDAWVRKPPSRRLSYHGLDLGLGRKGEIGRGWSCDWELLLGPVNSAGVIASAHQPQSNIQAVASQRMPLTQRQRKAAKALTVSKTEVVARRRNSSSPESGTDIPSEHIMSDFAQLPPFQASSIIADPAVKNLPAKPVLVSVKITLLTKGTPDRTARIYRLPKDTTPDESRDGPKLTQPTHLSTFSEHHRSITRPPAAAPPSVASRTSRANQVAPSNLRSRWLDHYREVVSKGRPGQDTVTVPIGKPRTNRHLLPPTHRAYPRPNLNHLQVVPRDAPQDVIDQYGPKPPSEAEIQAQHEADFQVQMEERAVWDTHIPCPDPDDLIGFVTSGGYNLAEGRGTAIGSIWLQRVVEGWVQAGYAPTVAAVPADFVHNHPAGDKTSPGPVVDSQFPQLSNRGPHGSTATTGTATRHPGTQPVDRERRLCIVRNSGESIGRLASWEICA